MVERVVVGASSPCFEECLEYLQVVAVDSLVDAAGEVGSVIEQAPRNLFQCLPASSSLSLPTRETDAVGQWRPALVTRPDFSSLVMQPSLGMRRPSKES